MNETNGSLDPGALRDCGFDTDLRSQATEGGQMNVCFALIFALAMATAALTLKLVADEWIRQRRYYNVDNDRNE